MGSWDMRAGSQLGAETELWLPVDPGHLSHIPGGFQEKRSQLG